MVQTNSIVSKQFNIFLLYCFSIAVCYCESSFLTTDERIRMAGFQSETHTVTTVDGYILTLFRIVSSQNSTGLPKRRFPILLQHGFMMSSDCFVIRNDASGFVLARDNWDVWLGNIRGNSYTRLHKWLSPNETEFWNYSFHDMARKDVPAMIDYILNHTSRPRLNYIGHSMGTTMFYVMASTLPSYNKKINAMISLSAVARMRGWHFLLDKNHSYFYHYIHEQMVMEEWSYGERIFPDSSSTKNFLHFLQNLGSGNFQRYDYGREKNLKVWGVETPPLYNLSKIRVPMAVYYASGDFVLEQDTEYLAKSLPNLVMLMKIPSLSFGHVDFCYATSDLNLEFRRKMLTSVTEVLAQRDKNLSPVDKILKNVCERNRDCVKVL